jgi:hypothetical protein
MTLSPDTSLAGDPAYRIKHRDPVGRVPSRGAALGTYASEIAFMFFFKKLVARFLFPVPLCAGLLVVGLILRLFTKRKKMGAGWRFAWVRN